MIAPRYYYRPSIDRGYRMWEIYEARRFLWFTFFTHRWDVLADDDGVESIRHLGATLATEQGHV